MKKVTIENTKNIGYLDFVIPEDPGVYLIVGANGIGKTTILVCLDRIGNPQAFARGFSSSRFFGEVDQYSDSRIIYHMDEPATHLVYRKGSQRWAVSPKKGSSQLQKFGFNQSVFIKADAKRIDVTKEEIREGTFVSADVRLKERLNVIFETEKFSNLKRLRNANGRGRQATFFYVIKDNRNQYYSEKRFSTGELAVLRLVERLLTVDNDSLVLLDEAEMALHPRIQKNLLEYLKDVAEEKNLTIFVSTHSVTMIKATDKNHIMALEEKSPGEYEVVCPCYPAKAIGTVDFADNVLYDAVFFVEDDMARLFLKKMLKRVCMEDPRFITITSCIVPVGGYFQTAELALRTKKQLLNRSHVVAVWDTDVFKETIPNDATIRNFYEQNRDTIFDLGLTPEVWLVNTFEERNRENDRRISERFHIDVSSIIQSEEYSNCDAENPRKNAKKKEHVIVKCLVDASGDYEEVVLEDLVQILIDNSMEYGMVMSTIAPMLNRT